MRARSLVAGFVALIIWAMPAVPAAVADDYDAALTSLANGIVDQLEKAKQVNGTVLDFTDLQGQSNELGRFLAQELSDKLVAAAKSVSFLDRAGLQYLLKENKLSAEGLIDPQTTRKLGSLIGVDTLIVGTATPLGANIRLSVRAISVETGKIVASQSVTLPGGGGLADLYTHGVTPTDAAVGSDSASASAASPPNIRDRFRGDSLRIKVKAVKYTHWLDGTDSCFNGDTCATLTFTLQNLSGISFGGAIKAGSTSIGGCVGNEDAAGGALALYDNHPGWSDDVSLERALRLVPANATVPVTIKVTHCTPTNDKTIDVSVDLTISADNQTFDFPLSATGVPIR